MNEVKTSNVATSNDTVVDNTPVKVTPAAKPKPKPKPQHETDVQNAKVNAGYYQAPYPDETHRALNEYLNQYGYGEGLTERERLVKVAAIALARLEVIDNPKPAKAAKSGC